jgi:hypothetical protein
MQGIPSPTKRYGSEREEYIYNFLVWELHKKGGVKFPKYRPEKNRQGQCYYGLLNLNKAYWNIRSYFKSIVS